LLRKIRVCQKSEFPLPGGKKYKWETEVDASGVVGLDRRRGGKTDYWQQPAFSKPG